MEQQLIRDFGIPQSAAAVIVAGFNDSLSRPVYTTRERRVIALLNQPCIRYPEIARRVGVTPQRVLQIAEDEGIKAAPRRDVCAIGRAIAGDGRLDSLRARCERHGLRLQLVKRQHQSTFSRSVAMIGGKNCNIRQATVYEQRRVGIKEGYGRKHSDNFEFILFYAQPLDLWITLPSGKATAHGTCFMVDECRKSGRGDSRHDWRDYIEAWHLLK